MRTRFFAFLGLTCTAGAFACGQEPCASPSCAVPEHLCNTCGELPACLACTAGCGGCMNGTGFHGCMGCQLPEPGICGTAQCWDCSGDPGIDIDSLTPAAQSKKLYEASLARITFEVPDDAGVFLLDQRMSALGVKRSFVVPVESLDTLYKYEIKVDVVRGGKKYFKKHRIADLQAGMILAVAVVAPPVPDGEPAVIELKAEPVHPGGKPPEEPTDDSPMPVGDMPPME